MNEINKTIFLKVFGIIFLAFGVGAILNSLYIKNPVQIFWMCYISLILIGAGLLARNSTIIISQIYIIAMPLAVWDIDFLYWMIMKVPLFGITDYFFLEKGLTLGKIISLQHLFTVPISIYSTYLIGYKKRWALRWSFIQILLVFIAVSLFTPKEENINCVFEPCIDVIMGQSYRVLWFLASFSMTFLTSIIIGFFLKEKNKS